MKKIAILLPLLLSFILLQGCHGSSTNSQSTVRLVNGTVTPLNMLWVQSGAASAVATAIPYGNASSGVSATDGVSSIELTSGGTIAYSGYFPFGAGTSYTLVAVPPIAGVNNLTNTLDVFQLVDNQTVPNSGYAIFDLVDKSGAGSLDVYVLQGNTTPTPPVYALATGINGNSQYTIPVTTTSATVPYHIQVTGANAGFGNDVRLDIPTVNIGNQQILTLVLSPSTGGGLVDGLVVFQQGQTLLAGQSTVTGYKNYSARVRVVANLQASGVITAASAVVASSPTQIASNMSSPSVGSYTIVPLAHTTAPQPLSIAVGTSANCASLSVTPGQDFTLLVLGSALSPTCIALTDNNTLPTSQAASLRLVNAVNSISGPISLWVNGKPPTTTPITAGYGQASAYFSLPAQSGNGTSFSFDVITTGTNYGGPTYAPQITLYAQNVNTLFVLGDITAISGVPSTDATQNP